MPKAWEKTLERPKKTLTKFLHDSACPFGQSGIYGIMQKFDKQVQSKMVDGKVDPKNKILSIDFQKSPKNSILS